MEIVCLKKTSKTNTESGVYINIKIQHAKCKNIVYTWLL